MSERFPGPAASPLPANPAALAGTAKRRRSAFESGMVVLAALALGAVAAPGVASEVSSTQLSDGHTFSEVWFASTPPQVSPDGQYAVYVQDAITNGAHELWSVPLAGGNPVRLSDVLLSGQAVKFAISPDSNYVVYLVDQDVVGVPELYSVDIAGGSRTKLNMNFYSLPGQVRDFLISPTSQRVYYAADGEVNNVIELWRVDIDGGTSTRLNAEVTSSYDVYEYAVGLTTGGSERVVYRVGRSTVSEYELWSVPGTGSSSSAGRISRTLSDGAVEGYFQISPNGTRVLYLADSPNASFNLYSVAITGGSSIQLNGALGGADGVKPDFRISPDSTTAVYRSDEGTDLVDELYSVPLTGGVPTKLNGALIGSGDVLEQAISPDGARVVYLADQFLNGLNELWSVALGGGTAIRLNGAIGGSSDVLDFAFSPDSARVVYRADSTDTLNELWSVPLAGGANTRLNRTLAAGGNVQAFLISPDSSWVVYGADQDQDAKDELLRVPLAGGTVEDVNGPLVFGGDVSLTFLSAPVFTISPDSLNILYAADEIVDGEIELFKSVVGGPPGAPIGVVAVAGNTQVTVTFAPPLNDGGSPITDYAVTPDPPTAGWADSEIAPMTHLVTGLANGTEYTFTVRATNAYGVGEPSAPSNPVTPSIPATVPGPPIISGPGLGATGWNNAATVAFDPPASDGGSVITGYTLTWTSSPITPGGVDIHAGSTLLDHYVRLLTNGVSYTFTVRATNAVGTGPASLASNAVIPGCDPALLCNGFELGDTSAWTPPPALNVVKTVTSSGPYAVGSVIDYSIVVTNTGFLTLTGVTVTDPGAIVGACTPAQPASVGSSATLTCPATHAVTQADLDAGTYLNTATADSDQTGADTGDATVNFLQTPALSIDKTAEQTNYTLPGEIINYNFLVTNSGNVTLAGPFSVADDKTTDEVCPPAPALAPGASITCSATYTITAGDITAGSVTNIAAATNLNEKVTSPTDSVTILYLGLVTRKTAPATATRR